MKIEYVLAENFADEVFGNSAIVRISSEFGV